MSYDPAHRITNMLAGGMRKSQPHSRAVQLDAAGNARLVVAYGRHHQRHAMKQRFHYRVVAGVAHDPGLQQRLADVAMPALQSRDPIGADVVRRWREALRQRL